MICPLQTSANAGILLDYCARRLDEQTMAQMSRHMAVCPDCRKVAEAQSHIWSALDAWETEPVSADFDERLYSRISEEERRSFWSGIFGEGLAWKPVLSLSAASAVLAITFVVKVPEARSPVLPPETVIQVEALDPEQIEQSAEDLEMLRQFSTPARSNYSI